MRQADAQEQARRILALDPDNTNALHGYSQLLAAYGRSGDSLAMRKKMQPLEPFRKQLVTVSKMKAPWGESIHLGASSSFLNGIGPVVSRDEKGERN